MHLQVVEVVVLVLHHLLQNHSRQAFRVVVKMVQKKYLHLEKKLRLVEEVLLVLHQAMKNRK
jgi:hypothetical protein